MTARRLSADAQARLDFAITRLTAAYRLQEFARAGGVLKELSPASMRALERDVEQARKGKPIPIYDAFGGRGRWAEKQKQKQTGSAHGEQPIVNRKAGAAQRSGSTPPPGTKSRKAA